ncbi:hypothetical protein VE04_08538 [Pseudogymnoascus sp. 24MN13]|nr:hypothetical protein VE04_08538 [Pseudogymnoascus sp. 24MN13]
MSRNRDPEDADKWFPTKESKQDLEDVQSSRDEFRDWVLANVRDTQSSATFSRKKSSKENGQPRGLPSIQDALCKSATYEEAYGFIKPFSTIDELGKAVQAQSELSQKRAHGIRIVGKGVQKFAETFLECLQAVKGIVDIAGIAAPPFVGVAYETLNILFTVAASKQKVEDELTDMLEDIKGLLPSLIVYDKIYGNPVLGKKIAAAYKSIIYFARGATKYYIANHGYKRLWRVLSGKQGFYVSNSSLEKDLLAVKHQCYLLLSVNIDKLKKLSENKQKKSDEKRLVKFRGYLAQPPSHKDKDLKESLARYTRILDGFSTNERVEQLSAEALLSLDVVKVWSESNHSQLLILAGMNELSTLEGDNLSWLSPAAIGLMQNFTVNGKTVIHYLCQESSSQPKDIVPQEIVSSLIYQLLLKHEEVLQDEIDSTQLEGGNIRVLDLNLNVLVEIMIQILHLLRHKEPIYIVLDRVDRCREKTMRKVTLLIALAEIVAREKCVIVKILVVVNTLYWETFERDWEALKKSKFYNSERVQQCKKDQQM